MRKYINIEIEVYAPSRLGRPYRPWSIQKLYKNDDQFIIPANTLKYRRNTMCSMAQIAHPRIDLRGKSEVTFTAKSTMRRFDSQGYNAKKKELVNELIKYGAHVTGVDWHDLKLDREIFYSTVEEEVTVKLTPSIQER